MSARREALARKVDVALAVIAAGLLASMMAAALHDASRAWDVWFYHLPFAGRLAGILPPSVFAFHPANQARFEGYPLLGELLQGALWRLTGRAESANLVSFASVPLLALFLHRRFEVPWPRAAIALLAIPLVHIHVTSSYVDLPANASLTALVLLAIAAHAEGRSVTSRDVVIALLAAGFAVNAKFQLHPFVLVAGLAFAWRAGPDLWRRRRPREIFGVVAALPLVFFRPLENLILHRNPYFPVRLGALGVTLPGPESPYGAAPPWLADMPRPVRFAASLFELGARPMSSTRRWTIDQWMGDAEPGARMGGFFHAYVLAMLAFLVLRVVTHDDRRAKVAGVGFATLTVVAAVVPQSHELRYYMVWMMTLVCLNFVLSSGPNAVPAKIGGRTLALVATAALAIVLAVTRGGYAYPSGSSVAELCAEKVDAAAIGRVPEGGEICVHEAPWNVLYAAPFHPGRRYGVREAETPAGCAGDPSPP